MITPAMITSGLTTFGEKYRAHGVGTATVIVFALATVLGHGCGHSLREPDLGDLYSEAAMVHGAERHPVIVIPGILGSKLRDSVTDTIVWGAFGGGYANPTTNNGAQLFAIPMAEGVPLRELDDTVIATDVLDRVRANLLFVPLELKAYFQILATLGAGGYTDEQLAKAGAIDYGNDHFSCFQFAYDWRRDNVENAALLNAFILEREQLVRANLIEKYGSAPEHIQFDIVAHSMGGLVTRYFLRYGDADLPADGSTPRVTWAGAKHVRNAVFVGTPNAGSVKALHQLVKGASFGPVAPRYPAALVSTLPAVYQLLPRSRHARLVDADSGQPIPDVLDPDLWVRMKWGLADPKQDATLKRLLPDEPTAQARLAVAVDHQRKCLDRARQFFAALDQPADAPAGLKLTLYAGDAVDTPSVVAVDSRTGRIRYREYAPGDGTVTRASALLDERVGQPFRVGLVSPIDWSSARFLFTNHIGITKDPAFSDNVLFQLLEL